MVIPASQQRIAVRELTDFCDRRIPLPDGDKKRLLHRWRGATVTLIEQRPWWTEGIPWVESAIAQFRFDPQRND